MQPASNFFFYNQLGNVAVIGFNGANKYDDISSYLDDSCEWASSINPALVVLLGHWNVDNDGCTDGSDVPTVYKALMTNPKCAAVAKKIKYLEGHTHCNKVIEQDVGFMVGANGMTQATDCGGVWGVTVMDTTNNRFRMLHFPLIKDGSGGYDNYDTINQCILQKGVSGCYDLAQEWANVPF